VVNDLADGCERDFDDLAVGAFHLDAWDGERLCHLHAADDAAHALAVGRDDFNVVLAVERPEGCEGFGDFHCLCTALSLVHCGGSSRHEMRRNLSPVGYLNKLA
jgi:hypothetical protein